MSTVAEPEPFDLAGPLPGPGITVLEASAGTGKTYTLTSLVVRFVAAGVPLSQMLAVTFTRMATGELRDRIRERLVEVHTQLASGQPSPSDPVAAAIGSTDPADAGLAAVRTADALAEFDSATIATTHSFCQMVLSELGSAGDTAPEASLLEDPSDLVAEAVDDLYLRWVMRRPILPFSPEVARQAAVMATRNPDVRIVPDGGTDPSALLGRLARAARVEVERRLLDRNLLTYDNLLYRLSQTLADPEHGRLACDRLRSRYQVVLVDEFQDTDPSQWQILRQAFGSSGNVLVLIGDPKQAIYGFRGADVYAYLDAARSATTRYTCSDNWRADQPLLQATDALLHPLEFGHQEIQYRPVRAAADRRGPGVKGHPRPAPLRVRVVADRQPGVRITSKGQLQKGSLVEWLAGDVATDIAQLLASRPRLTAGAGERDLQAGDVAVLTRTNRQALQIRQALQAVDVPSVVAGLDSVFASQAARSWLSLLDALQEPASRSRVAAVAMTAFIGMDARGVATASESRWEGLHDRVHRWAAVAATRGVAALYRTILVDESLPARVVATEGGERLLTDLGHVAQLLHAEAQSGQMAAPSLRAWLAARIQAAAREQNEAEERSRRLESDSEAVQILTIHRAKGLEFPVVYCPYLWDAGKAESRSAPLLFHDPANGDSRTLDVGCPPDDQQGRRRYDDHAALARAERRGEELRLLYVALTRARHQVVLWWAAAKDSRLSPLARLLMCRDAITGAVTDVPRKEPSARQITAVLDRLAQRAPGLVSVEAAAGWDPAAGARRPRSRNDAGPLQVAEFGRALDLRWGRASYTSITAAAHDPRALEPVASEPEDAAVGDEPAPTRSSTLVVAGGSASGTAGRPAGPSSLLAELPGGTDIGIFVHRVLERLDFATADLESHLTAVAADVAARSVPGADLTAVVPGLLAALSTPLGPLLPDMTLRSIHRADRLDELSFELPVAGGDQPWGEVRTEDVAGLLTAHLPDHGTLGGYAGRLADPLLATELRGYLTGSLDLVFRVGRPAGSCRWFLADYKTNRLGDPGRVLTLPDYGPAALDAEMQRRHYPLQALLYMVALHRYLRWRQPGYDPDVHLGGVLYLFIRGMGGPATPVIDGHPCGVFSWAPPATLVVALSELFHRGGER